MPQTLNPQHHGQVYICMHCMSFTFNASPLSFHLCSSSPHPNSPTRRRLSMSLPVDSTPQHPHMSHPQGLPHTPCEQHRQDSRRLVIPLLSGSLQHNASLLLHHHLHIQHNLTHFRTANIPYTPMQHSSLPCQPPYEQAFTSSHHTLCFQGNCVYKW